jgi:hypothetical protein
LLYLGKNFNPNNPASGWNGRSNDNPCNPGVYVYLVKARFLDGHIETIGGDLTLMR